ncbi:Zn(II)2Cys6 transcription factor, partial [Aspergillus sclerotiicarbonarius CBS 121057]
MPMQSPKKNLNPPKIRRSHSGCRPCRRRGKRCDETKPSCRACARLSLECSYGVNFSFHNFSVQVLQHAASQSAPSTDRLCISNSFGNISNVAISAALSSGDNLEFSYLNHFREHVRHLLPAVSPQVTDGFLQSPCLRSAVLCISASNLSMLNARVQSRTLVGNSRRSVFSPLVNMLHHNYAQKYHNLALGYLRNANPEAKDQAPALLAAHVLLAYYHHASTDHLSFRLAVEDSVRFVLQNRASITDSPDGAASLQMWYRLCTSHRPAKPPALLLEGVGASTIGPNPLPDVSEHLYLRCILGMNGDDLIYDILIKVLEIRTKLVVFRCVAGSCQISELSSEIGSLAYEIMNKMLGRQCVSDDYAEAREGCVRGSHLLGLLEVQKERLKVWRSILDKDQLSINPSSLCRRFPTHRDAMNALYYMLCEITFEEANICSASDRVPGHEYSATIGNMAHTICHIASQLSFNMSNTSDVYTLSLAEVLLQLVFASPSDQLFHYILDVLWPQLEMNGKGYEHSHYPTHLVKRIIAQTAAYWEEGRAVTFALPAVAENISKQKLLDIDHPVDLVVCGYNNDGQYFIEKALLP